MSDIRQAFLDAARKNPQRKSVVVDAVKLHKKNLSEAERIKEQQKEEFEKQLALEKQMAEAERRHKEVEIMQVRYPFKFSFSHFFTYSRTYGIVFALTLDDALEAVKAKIKEVERSYVQDKHIQEWFSNEANLRIEVEQIDLSKGIAIIGEYME